MDRESLELLLGQGLSLEQIGKRFGKHPSTVSYWMAKHALQAVKREKHSAKGRDRAGALGCVGGGGDDDRGDRRRGRCEQRHGAALAGAYGLRTQNTVGRRRRETARAAKDAGLLTVTLSCPHHGETEVTPAPCTFTISTRSRSAYT